jgi:hypothetical protein
MMINIAFRSLDAMAVRRLIRSTTRPVEASLLIEMEFS